MEDKSEKRDMTNKIDENFDGDNNPPENPDDQVSKDIPPETKADDELPVCDETPEIEESDLREEPEEITYSEIKRKKRKDFWRKIILPYCMIGIGVFTLFKAWGIVTIPWAFVLTIDLVTLVIALRMSGILSPALAVSLATISALVPQYYIRSTYNIYIYLTTKFGTYPSDLWYCWNHYLAKGFPYPREYPSGIQMIFKFLYQVKPKNLNFDGYMIIICIFMGIFALLITYLLYGLVEKTHKKTWKIWVFWIFAPSFLWYALYNVDLISVFTIVMGYYLFVEEEYYLSAAIIALGTALKVFPIFMTPLLLFQCPKKKRLGSILTFVGVWVGFNLPFMLKEWDAWKYPYQWQIKHNFAKNARDGSFFWVIHIILNNIEVWVKTHIPRSGFLWNIHMMLSPYKYHMGKVSLLLYGALYYLFLRKKWDLPFARKCAGIMMLFLLTDRIYSPQYHLYLLPFLVLVDYNFKKKIHKILFLATFYIAEIPNALHTVFMFKIRHIEHHVAFLHNWLPAIFTYKFPYIFQGMMIVKYLAIITLFLINWYAPVNPEAKEWKDGSGKLEEEKQKSESEEQKLNHEDTEDKEDGLVGEMS
ncbi:MAG: DUF2029 domain-containing protein [Candidatus Eremiobacteraeota bacterium]|nr:DUF2029 domain-containing protein [Candidatus Eremiobacteraeota bacterium]